MVKEETFYTTSDGKQYKTKKAAERNENELTLKNAGYTKKEVDGILEEIAKDNRNIKILMDNEEDWRNLPDHLVKQFPKLIEDHKNDVVSYLLIKIVGFGRNEREEVVQRLKMPRLEDGEMPEKYIKHVKDLTEKDKDIDGSTYRLVYYDKTSSDKIKKYRVEVENLTPEEKLEKGLKLREDDIETLLFEREEIYEEDGEVREWNRSVTTVIEANDGNQYVIHWEKGNTEMQSNDFWEQPKRVELRRREVTTVVTEIVYLDTEENTGQDEPQLPLT